MKSKISLFLAIMFLVSSFSSSFAKVVEEEKEDALMLMDEVLVSMDVETYLNFRAENLKITDSDREKVNNVLEMVERLKPLYESDPSVMQDEEMQKMLKERQVEGFTSKIPEYQMEEDMEITDSDREKVNNVLEMVERLKPLYESDPSVMQDEEMQKMLKERQVEGFTSKIPEYQMEEEIKSSYDTLRDQITTAVIESVLNVYDGLTEKDLAKVLKEAILADRLASDYKVYKDPAKHFIWSFNLKKYYGSSIAYTVGHNHEWSWALLRDLRAFCEGVYERLLNKGYRPHEAAQDAVAATLVEAPRLKRYFFMKSRRDFDLFNRVFRHESYTMDFLNNEQGRRYYGRRMYQQAIIAFENAFKDRVLIKKERHVTDKERRFLFEREYLWY